MATALLASIAAIAIALWFGTPTLLDERLARLAGSAAVLGAWLAAAIGRVAMLRFFSVEDFDAAVGSTPPSEALRQAAANLQNTLEQATLALLAYLAAALVIPGSAVLVPILAGLFSVGRTLFWAGYGDGAQGRALGFALTFYPSVLTLLLVLGTLALGVFA
jgi:hypothetical protein